MPLLADIESSNPGDDDGRKPPVHIIMPAVFTKRIVGIGLHVGGGRSGALMVYVMDEMPYLQAGAGPQEQEEEVR